MVLRAVLPHIFQDYSTTSLAYASVIVIGTLSIIYYLITPRYTLPHDAPKYAGGRVPIFGALAFFSKRLDFFREASSKTSTGNFSFFIGQYPVIGIVGEEPRHAFFHSKALSASEGYGTLFGISPNAQIKLDEGDEGPDLDVHFRTRLLRMTKKENLVSILPTLKSDLEKDLGELEANPSRITDPFESLYRLVFKLTIRVVGCKEFAEDPVTLEKVLNLYELIEGSSTAASTMFPKFPSLAIMKRTYAGTRLYMLLSKVVEGRKSTGIREDDPLQILVDEGDDIKRIISFIIGALFAGILNSGINAAYVLGWLGLESNAHWQRQAREEVEAIAQKYRPDDNVPLIDKLASIPIEAWEGEFKFLDLCLKDSIRLNLLGTAFRKNISTKSVQVGREVVPPGALVAYHLADIHQDPEIYPNPEEWDPSRYIRGEDKKKPQAWVGWGTGRHPCLGMRFAKLEMNMIAAYFLAMFDYETTDRSGTPLQKIAPIDQNSHSAVKPKERFYLKYQARS